MYLLSVVTLIALCELYRLYYIFRPAPRSKRSHFKSKLKATREMRWDMEFKVFKTREIREEVREQYDTTKAKVFNLEQLRDAIEAGKPEREPLQKDIDKLTEDAKRYEGHMRQLDVEVSGAAPSADYPEGALGATDQIESLRELEGMLSDYIKTL